MAAWALLLMVLGGCSVHPWRSSSDPLALAAADGTPLRVTTRAAADGRAHRYVISSARVEGDSLVGVAYEEYERLGDGRWSLLEGERDPRVSLAIADLADVSRREREFSPARTSVVMVVVAAVVVGAYYGLIATAYGGGCGC